MSYLTGTKVDNPLPEHTDDDKLADEFADFLWEKLKQFVTVLQII